MGAVEPRSGGSARSGPYCRPATRTDPSRERSRSSMATYMTQFSYTAEAWAALAKNPANRREGIQKLFDAVGGKLIELYYCLGEYDGVVIAEAPDDAAVVSA